MQFAVAFAVAAASVVSASKLASNETVSYTTEVVTQYTTYCPNPTTITDGDNVITVTEPTIVTITHCPGGCTIEKPCTTSTVVECEDCEEPTYAPEPTVPASNATATPTGSYPEPTPEEEEPVIAGAATLVGSGLAAFAGLVAFVL
ncbi:uncharacterized protein DNG_00930 [Cephalotrichum gorgonifer]|uniref:Uncharacterized protein n=1 Tax=Cephalotrichum gorgonifer TaxID=2041049 RepID=A0AAE8MQR9_9PEZI|nr:uncharacterized protein DNG_00930 [Cephalotrichum gorgonifer]